MITDTNCDLACCSSQGFNFTFIVGTGKTMNSLQARSSREEWEKSFSDQYIQPVLEKLGVKLDRALQQMLKDKSRGLSAFV